MKVLFVSPSFYPAFHYGGPTFINRSFCDAMARCDDVEVDVLTTDANGPRRVDVDEAQRKHAERYRITYCHRWWRPDIAPGLCLRLVGRIWRADVVHLNGVYSFTTIPTLALCRLLKKPLVWSTMGALQRWEGTTHPRMKAVWERICNSLCRPARVLMHVTSEEEREESLEKIPQAGVLLLRNGIDIPDQKGIRAERSAGPLHLLFLGRLHPIKGIENLLRALLMVNSTVRLAICGEGVPEYEVGLRALIANLGLADIVTLHGRVDGEAKEQHFREADLCIAPSFKEAFCTVLLESLARGVPVISSRGIPWERLEEMGCGLWVSNEPAELAKAIDRAAAMPLTEMGRRGRAWMQQQYSWAEVAGEMIAEYRRMKDQEHRKVTVAASPKAA